VVVGTRIICPSANLTTENDFCCNERFVDDDSPVALTRTTFPLSVFNVDFGCKCGIRTINGFAVCCIGLLIIEFFFFVFFFSSVLFLCKRFKDFSNKH
jgi:hypothetical protein